MQSIITLFGGSMTYLLSYVRYALDLPDVARAIGIMWYNFYVLVLTFYWGYKSPLTKKFLQKFFKPRKILPYDQCDDELRDLDAKKKTEKHFECLRDAWN
uniref:Uncharacterized protein n=1 Tax=Panagrolaimus sp. JU765 TaxID=591449 RepID=A0AC34RD31_9BILA